MASCAFNIPPQTVFGIFPAESLQIRDTIMSLKSVIENFRPMTKSRVRKVRNRVTLLTSHWNAIHESFELTHHPVEMQEKLDKEMRRYTLLFGYMQDYYSPCLEIFRTNITRIHTLTELILEEVKRKT